MAQFGPDDLYEWRIRNNLTQGQAAKVLGVATGTLKNWEQGIRRIPATIELLIAKIKPRDLPADRGAAGTRPIGVRTHKKRS